VAGRGSASAKTAREHGVRRGGAGLGRSCGVVNGERGGWPGARRRALLGVVLCAQGNEQERGKEKGGKENREKGRERGGCIGEIRGGGRERAVRRARGKSCVGRIRGDGRERAARRARLSTRHGAGVEEKKGWRLVSDIRRRRVENVLGD
jgi:hypothetical protein